MTARRSARAEASGRPSAHPASVPAPVAALTGLVLVAALGLWLAAAPFVLDDQPRAAAWTAATRVDLATGAALCALAVLGLLGYLAAALAWLARYGR